MTDDEELRYALANGLGQHQADADFLKARRQRQNLAFRGIDTYQEPQSPVMRPMPIEAGDSQASFLRSEKDARPYWETDHRGMIVPAMKSGYNDSITLANPVLAGGSAPSVLNDIIEGRQVAKGEIEQAAGDAAGAAMTGSLAMTRPHGSVGSGGRRANELPMDQASRIARAKEMGFDTDTTWYHGTRGEDFSAFDPSMAKVRRGENGGVYFSKDPDFASFHAMYGHDEVDKSMPSGVAVGRAARVIPSYLRKGSYSLDRAGHAVVHDPTAIRSVNAAFDPAMAWSANLLAANAPTSAAAPSLQHIAKTAAQETKDDDKIVDILRKYGLIGGAVGLGALQDQQQAQPAQ